MKKISLLLASILAAVTVSGCDMLDNFFGIDTNKQTDQGNQDNSNQDNQDTDDDSSQDQTVTKYTVSFNSNGGSGSMSSFELEGTSYKVPECTFTYSGYHFIYWKLNDANSGNIYYVGDRIQNITGNITLYANWESDSAQSFTVYFEGNGGSGTMANATTLGSTYKTPTTSTFTKEDYYLKEWALGSVGGDRYQKGQTIYNITSNITLYAKWEVEDPYYDGCESLTGTALLEKLRSINEENQTGTVGYDPMGTTPSGKFKYTDYDTNYVQYDSKGQPYGTRIISFYSGNSTTSFNRTHVAKESWWKFG